MSRKAVLLIMLLAMFWQSVAMARIGSSVNVLTDLRHAALHWQQDEHHHHDDGTYHLDDSNESARHLLTDNLGATAVTMVMAACDFPPPGSATPGGLHETPVPGPTPDGLLRPPRTRS